MVSNPHVRVKGKSACHSDVECSYLPRGTYTNCRGVALYPVSNQIRINSQCMRMFPLKQGGLYMDPQKYPNYHHRQFKNVALKTLN